MNPRRPSIRPSLRLSPVSDGMIAFDPAKDHIYHLNATATLLFMLCDARHEVDEIKAAVLGSVAKTDHASVDATGIEGWFDQALKDGLIVCDESAGPMPPFMDTDELLRLASQLRDGGDTNNAYRCFRAAADLSPDSPDAWYGVGELALIRGGRQEARTAYERYMAFEPNDAEIAHILVALSGGSPPARASDDCILRVFKSFSDYYDKHMREELDYRAPEELQNALAELVRPEKNKLDILDLGCGTGIGGEAFKPWARWLEGVDLSPEMSARARERGVYDAVHVSEITSWLTQAPRTYDLILFCDVFVYFGDITGVLKEAVRVLSPGGWIGFTVERSVNEAWTLTDSGRYAHSNRYVCTTAGIAGMRVAHLSEKVIRMECGEPVVGLIAVLEKGMGSGLEK